MGSPLDADAATLRRKVLAWYAHAKRDLPWRDIGDPYAVWVSEIMLQQTRVETVVPYFIRWMARFPDVAALAAAPVDDVLSCWSGLGYYSRARNLHRAAQEVVRAHGGRLPTTREGLSALPGIGAYTSGAIASIAFGERVPAVDGNVLRVLSRWTGDARDILDPKVRRDMEATAAALVPARRAGDWNQALMELGATVCAPRGARCGGCPVQTHCAAFAEGRVDDLPFRSPKRAPRAEEMRFALVQRDDQVLLVQNNASGLLASLWGLPGGPALGPLDEAVRDQTGLAVDIADSVGTAEHRFTHRHWRMTVHPASPRTTQAPRDGARWFALDDLADAALSTAHRKAIAAGLAAARDASDRSFL